MSKEKQEENSPKKFNILETSFGGGLDIEFKEGHTPEIEEQEEEEEHIEEIEKPTPEAKEIAKPKVKKTETEETESTTKSVVKSEETKGTKTTETQETEESSLKAFASWLGEKGIVDYSDESFEDSEEGLEKLVVGSIEKGISDYKNSLPEDFHKLVEFVEAGGNPKDFVEAYYNNKSWEDFEISDEKSQRLVLEEFLRAQAADDKGNVSKEDLEDITETLDTYEVSGILEKKAKGALAKLQAYEKTYKSQLVESQKKYDTEKKALQKKQVEEFKEVLYKKDEIQGFKLTPKLKDNLWDFIMKPDKTGKTGLQKHNETNQDAQFMYAYLAMSDWNLEKLERQVKTKVNSELASKLGNYKDSRSKMKSGQSDGFADKRSTSGFSAFRQALDNGEI